MLLGLLAGAVAFVPGGASLWGMAVQAGAAVMRCKPCLWATGTAALCAWTAIHIHRADVVACSERIEDDHRKAEIARADRDRGVEQDLERRYRPQIGRLQTLNANLTKKVEDAKQKPAAAGSRCKLGAAAGLLQPTPIR